MVYNEDSDEMNRPVILMEAQCYREYLCDTPWPKYKTQCL